MAILLFAILSATSGSALPQIGSTSPPGVSIKVQADPKKATVGDPIRIDVDIACPGEYQVRVTEPEKQLGQFSILAFYPDLDSPSLAPEAGKPPQAPADNSTRAIAHHRARIVVAAYKTGEFEIPPLTITLMDKSGQAISIPMPETKIQIVSVLSEKDQNLKDLKRQAEIQEPVRWWLWWSLALLALALVVVAWGLWRRKSRPSIAAAGLPKMDPLDAAEAELRDLLSRGLLEKGFVKQFYVVLSEIVRKILEAGYAIPTLERTTSEIMDELRGVQGVGAVSEILTLIEVMLTDCDLVKFAKYKPTSAESGATADRAFRILRECRSRKAVSAHTAPGISQEAC